MSSVRPSVLLLIALLAVCSPSAHATWSIVLVDKATGEVGVAGATCLESLDLLESLPVVRVGVGGACAQSALDQGAVNRKKIWNMLQAGTPPEAIIAQLQTGDLLKCSRQYGIAVLYDAEPPAAAFTGGCAGAGKAHATGTSGTLTWAVQGNVLTGAVVVDAAVAAILATPGRLADRLMAGMQAAYLMGGDGRCSCEDGGPTACGAPPPEFEKTAHIGFLVTARIGDVDGVCNGAFGCANGDYWLKLNVIGVAADEDPVLQLQSQYDAFLADLSGRPDGLLSVAAFDDDEVPGDGASVRELHVGLVDVHGQPVMRPVGAVSVSHAPGSAGLSSLDGLVDHGDGTYTVRMLAGSGVGTDTFVVTFDDGVTQATLYPYPSLSHRPALLADGDLSAAAGGVVTFDLLAPDAFAGRRVLLDLSVTGSVPTLPGGGPFPALIPDLVSRLVPRLAQAGVLVGVPGVLDAGGRAEMSLQAPPGLLGPLAGLDLHAAFLTVPPGQYWSNAVVISVAP